MDTPGSSSIMTAVTLNTLAFVFLVFDVSNKASFDNMETFIENFNHNNKNENRLLYIIGNKSDKDSRKVMDEGQNFADIYGLSYFETSAKSGANVDNVFKMAMQKICDNLEQKKYDPAIKLEKFGITKTA